MCISISVIPVCIYKSGKLGSSGCGHIYVAIHTSCGYYCMSPWVLSFYVRTFIRLRCRQVASKKVALSALMVNSHGLPTSAITAAHDGLQVFCDSLLGHHTVAHAVTALRPATLFARVLLTLLCGLAACSRGSSDKPSKWQRFYWRRRSGFGGVWRRLQWQIQVFYRRPGFFRVFAGTCLAVAD